MNTKAYKVKYSKWNSVSIFLLKCFTNKFYTLLASQFFNGTMLTVFLSVVLFKRSNFETITKILWKSVKQAELVIDTIIWSYKWNIEQNDIVSKF